MKRRISTLSERYTVAPTKAFNKYLKDIYSYTTLTPEEEYALCSRMVAGDEVAREKLIKHNLRFVISVAKQYYSTTATLEDLVNEGNYGLIIASQKFDPTRGFKFITYAVYWIRNSILKFINTTDSLVKIPNHKLFIINKLRVEYNRLEQTLQKKPSLEDLKEYVGTEYSYTDIQDFYDYNFTQNQHLDDTFGDDESMTFMETVENNVLPNSDVLTEASDSTIRLTKMMGLLKNDKQFFILTKFYGLDGKDPLPIEVISREMGLTKERVRQIKEKSLILLRNKVESKYIYS